MALGAWGLVPTTIALSSPRHTRPCTLCYSLNFPPVRDAQRSDETLVPRVAKGAASAETAAGTQAQAQETQRFVMAIIWKSVTL
jgi:hypothetical protein